MFADAPVAMQRMRYFWWPYSRNFLQKRGLNVCEIIRPHTSRASKKLIKCVGEVYLYALAWCTHLEWQCRHSKQPMAVWEQLTFYSWYSPYICIISLLTKGKGVLFKGGCINWLGKSSLSIPPPQQYEDQCYASEIDLLFRSTREEAGGRGEEKKKRKHVFKLEASLNWWAPGVELFCREIICIMGSGWSLSWELSSCGDSQWSGRKEFISDRRPIPWFSERVMYAGDMIFCFLSPFICPFHLQNNLPTLSQTCTSQYVLMNLL